MNRTNAESSNEKTAMRFIFQSAVDTELAEFNAWNQIPHEYSDGFMKRLHAIFRRYNKKSPSAISRRRRIVICIAAVIALILVACAAIEPIRTMIAGAIVTWYEKRNEIVFETHEESGKPMHPTYVPDGFELTYCDVNDELAVLTYGDGKNEYAFMRLKNHHDTGIYADNEKCVMEEMDWRGGKAIYFKPIYEGVQHSIMWEEEGYVYIIDSSVSKEALFEFAESIKAEKTD